MLRSIASTIPRAATRVALRNAPVVTKTLLPTYSSAMCKAMPALAVSPALRAFTTAVAPELKRAAVQCMYLFELLLYLTIISINTLENRPCPSFHFSCRRWWTVPGSLPHWLQGTIRCVLLVPYGLHFCVPYRDHRLLRPYWGIQEVEHSCHCCVNWQWCVARSCDRCIPVRAYEN